MSRSPALALRVLAVAAGLGAALHMVKGSVLLVGGADLSVVPAMSLLFGIGSFGLHVSRSRLSEAAAAIMSIAIAASLATIGYQLAGHAPEDAGAPVGVDVAYALATLGILLGLLLFASAFRRSRVLEAPWRAIPLVAAIVWFPLEALTAVLPDGWGLLCAGGAWMAVAVAIWLRAGRPSSGRQ